MYSGFMLIYRGGSEEPLFFKCQWMSEVFVFFEIHFD
jgi:hypothetical protein